MTQAEPTESQVMKLARVIRAAHLRGLQPPWDEAEGYIQEAWMRGARAAWSHVVNAMADTPVVAPYMPGDKLVQNDSGRVVTIHTVTYRMNAWAKVQIQFADEPWVTRSPWNLDKEFTRLPASPDRKLKDAREESL